MITRRASAVIAIIVLIAFSAITVETIGNSSSSVSSTITGSQSHISLYSPINGSVQYVMNENQSIGFNVSIISNDSPVYIYNISPTNSTSLPKINGIQVLSIMGLTEFNKTQFPFNYQVININPEINTTLNLTLFFNSTQFSQMKVSNPQQGSIYPYLVEIVTETASGASFIGFTIVRI